LKTDIFMPRVSDITRASSTVSAVRADAGTKPYSFTIIAGPSFSDLHYRYFFRVQGRDPLPVISSQYELLYLVCDKETHCPSVSEVTSQKEIPVLCYDDHCGEFYPSISLAREWTYTKDISIPPDGEPLSHVYVFSRR
jgi:hypothetical protein